MKRDDVGEIKPCPFCGHKPFRDNLIDSLHPTGSYWTYEDGFGRHYWSPHFYGKERGDPTLPEIHGEVWEFSCLETEGGCGAEMRGDSMEEVLEKWNRRSV